MHFWPHCLRHVACLSVLLALGASVHAAESAPTKKPAPAAPLAAPAESVAVESRMAKRALPSAAVVVLSNAAGRPFDGAVDRHLLRFLMGSMKTAPMSATHAAVARVHGNAKTLHSPATLMAVGRRMKVPFVLVVEAIGKKRPTHIFVGLVDVVGKRTILAHREPLRGGKLDAATGRQLAERISDALAAHGPKPVHAPVHDDMEPPEKEPEAPGALAHGGDKAAGAADEEGDSPKARRHAESAPHGHKALDADAAKLENGLSRGLLPKARLFAGAELMQRVSRLKTPAVDGVSPPCYCGNRSNAQPFFPAFFFGGELSSGLFTHGRRRPQDGIGIYGQALVAPVRTRVIRDGTSTNVSSTVFGMDLGAFYRLAWFPNKAVTPDIKLSLGLNRFVFPLKNTQYTGVNYGAFNFGLAVDVPIRKQFGVFAGLDLRPGLKAGKQAQTLLGTPKAGFGVGAHAGLRAAFSLLAFEFAFQFDRYEVPFVGTTNLPDMPAPNGTPVQFTNVKLTDQLLSLLLRVNLAF